jgi:hypothetical protein
VAADLEVRPEEEVRKELEKATEFGNEATVMNSLEDQAKKVETQNIPPSADFRKSCRAAILASSRENFSTFFKFLLESCNLNC